MFGVVILFIKSKRPNYECFTHQLRLITSKRLFIIKANHGIAGDRLHCYKNLI